VTVQHEPESAGTSLNEQEPALEAKRSKALLWVLVGLVAVVGVGLAAISMVGGSVLYYKTPTEIVASHSVEPVRLAGQLVNGSVNNVADGGIVFQITDGKTTVDVVYHGGATTALTTASKPGTQMVAEGTLGADGKFQSTNLMAKCPSKFQQAKASSQPVPES
jgi:cytochrome c-type biogenesis protein CcmE